MNIEELKVGNMLIHHGLAFRLTPNHLADILLSDAFAKQHQPIPITPEWLERLGFEKETSDDSIKSDVWSIQVGNSSSLYFDVRTNSWYIAAEWNNVGNERDFWASPKYVHTLQNLIFALTGEELKPKD